MCVRTRCRTVDELVGLFGRYLEGNSLFVATLGARGEGFETEFTIALVDGVIALRGRGIVEKAWSNGENRFRLPGILLSVRMLTASSKALFDRIRAERDRNASSSAPLTRAPVRLADIESRALADRQPARMRAATIPPVPRTTTPPQIKREFHRARGSEPAIVATEAEAKPANATDFAEEPPTTVAPNKATPSETAATIPSLATEKPRRRAGWTAVLLVLLPIVGFTGGAVVSNATAGEAQPVRAQIPVHATIEIDGKKYSVDVVLTADRER
jgi:hypothetical protein